MPDLVVGLTGGAGSGKSEASHFLSELGAYVIDADQVSKEVIARPNVQAEIKEILPQAFENGVLNRQILRDLIFSSRDDREKLNYILHPLIFDRMVQMIADRKDQVCFLAAPLLIESGLHHTVDEIWVIDVSPQIQRERLMERDKISKEKAEAMIQSQISREERRSYADVIIDNSGSMEKFKTSLEKAWETLLSRVLR
jgi:dephospho-CoA kinase